MQFVLGEFVAAAAVVWADFVFGSTIVDPSQASFNDGSLILDTVGILVGDGWRTPKEIDVKWHNKSFRCLCKEDRIDWVPKWTGKPECSQSGGRRAAKPKISGNRSDSNQMEGEGSPLHGENSCMGNNMCIDNSGGAKRVPCVYKFAAGNSKENSAHLDRGSPSIQEVAQKIGLKPRKRPKQGSLDDDPFNLDQIIGAESQPCSGRHKSVMEDPGAHAPSDIPIPDLNESMVGSKQKSLSGNYLASV
ncbi:hypothetical protein L1987_63783 [Smallanthus sonchifolius]|uniref:Uncharacterized protein n=1 Tax=Smallanthus sonchifolius TaxID=185202 RepID=A0ACB9CE87_9ASTR|nr:hypothetical protein L1987_63783 [Smallanthus sonchifolius]